MPFIAPRVWIFGINLIDGMHHARLNILKAVRFFSDISNLVDADVTALQKPNGLSIAGISDAIRAFRFRMEFIFGQDLSVGLDAGAFTASVVIIGRDPVARAGVLVKPLTRQPFSRVGFIG